MNEWMNEWINEWMNEWMNDVSGMFLTQGWVKKTESLVVHRTQLYHFCDNIAKIDGTRRIFCPVWWPITNNTCYINFTMHIWSVHSASCSLSNDNSGNDKNTILFRSASGPLLSCSFWWLRRVNPILDHQPDLWHGWIKLSLNSVGNMQFTQHWRKNN